MRESLRLAPTAPARGVVPLRDTVLGGKYAVKEGASLIVNAYSAHRDPKVWGDDVGVYIHIQRSWWLTSSQAEQFRPERMLDGKFEALPVCFLVFIN